VPPIYSEKKKGQNKRMLNEASIANPGMSRVEITKEDMAAMLEETQDRDDFGPILCFSKHELKSNNESQHDNGDDDADGDESAVSPATHLRDTKFSGIREMRPIS